MEKVSLVFGKTGPWSIKPSGEIVTTRSRGVRQMRISFFPGVDGIEEQVIESFATKLADAVNCLLVGFDKALTPKRR